ncbi:methyltransferase domain-containing protein [Ornithinibacillus sp. L9]|uniref:Methyltransferase domain-containing protein n=1 Tax=Ornithinibacillus caprae TaxID=2678566 RepID=A0A6N8FL06_9BACI|nr:methyltransferase domain-containing protein [Ornithinibacillus caprae]MUK87978.1 methyltransferase domain-containing protein [Ornithinibacillus caprae]
MGLIDPSSLSGWLVPHSLEWYQQLSRIQDTYTYPWDSTVTIPNGETVFDDEVTKTIQHKKVLDVGCGHGEFTIQCSDHAKEIVGLDVTDNFIKNGNENSKSNVSFVVWNTKQGLPFQENEFDCAYVRKGPTSSYLTLKKVVRSGGEILGLHPGDKSGKELPFLFPNLFSPSQSTQILDALKQRLDGSDFLTFDIEEINSIEYLHEPIDVLRLCCFGQSPDILETVKQENFAEIEKIFGRHTTNEGLPITYARYLVRATV